MNEIQFTFVEFIKFNLHKEWSIGLNVQQIHYYSAQLFFHKGSKSVLKWM